MQDEDTALTAAMILGALAVPISPHERQVERLERTSGRDTESALAARKRRTAKRKAKQRARY